MEGSPVTPASEVALAERLARIEVKLDTVLSKHDDHERRIRWLERAIWVAVGLAASLGGGIGAVVTKLLGVG